MIVNGGAVHSDRPALRRCVAVDPEQFAQAYWDQRPLLSRAVDLPTDFADLLSLADVDELLSRRGLRTPFIRLAHEGRIVDSKQYTGSGGVGAKIRDQVIDEKVLAEFAAGATVVLQGLHRLWPPLIGFTEQLVSDLGHPVQINAYITPPQSQGFADHYDTHDVFVLALAGRKRWRVRPPVIPRPSPADPWTDHAAEVKAAAEQPPLIDTVLEPGDALYLPRGYLHAAAAEGGVCAHLTVGIHPITRRSIAEVLLATVASDPAFDAALPLRALDDATMAREVTDVAATLRDRIADASVTPDAATVVRALARNLTDDTRPAPINPIAMSEAARLLGPADVVRMRDGLRMFVDKDQSGNSVLEAGIARIDISTDMELAIEGLRAGATFRADRLPGLAPEASLALAVLLLRAGILVPAST